MQPRVRNYSMMYEMEIRCFEALFNVAARISVPKSEVRP
jgi:hypothetical protein